jgi:hypothetical protein
MVQSMNKYRAEFGSFSQAARPPRIPAEYATAKEPVQNKTKR